MKHILSPARHLESKGLIGLELDLPEISIEMPTPAELAKATAQLVAERLRDTIQRGQDVHGSPLRAPSQATLERRARDKYPPLHPRSNRWLERYPGRVRAMLKGTLTPGVIKSRTNYYKRRRKGVGPYRLVKSVIKWKNLSVSQLAAVDSGALWSRIRMAAAGSGSAEVEAPRERPIADIEQRLGSVIFAATPAMLSESLDAAMERVFDSWEGGGGGAAGGLRRALGK